MANATEIEKRSKDAEDNAQLLKIETERKYTVLTLLSDIKCDLKMGNNFLLITNGYEAHCRSLDTTNTNPESGIICGSVEDLFKEIVRLKNIILKLEREKANGKA